ncbi:MAG TPA: PilZ domain-containing protein [Myxococcota bacterium]|jgi:hypothetical protein|nr:PilZ domain-containing protein [Myxococcota bacterium]
MEALPATAPHVVLVDDGGLDDVAQLLAKLRVEAQRLAPEAVRRSTAPTGAIWIASVGRALELDAAIRSFAPSARVAIADGISRTARTQLRRVGVDFLVCRPTHPEALRLFFARLVYRGPEKRFAPRLAAGLPVYVRARLRKRPATLIEISRTGAQLACARDYAEGRVLTLFVPRPGGGRHFPLRVRVVRRSEVREAAPDARFVLGLALDSRGRPAERRDLAALLAEHAVGPAAGSAVAPAAEAQPDAAERRVGQRRPYATPLLTCTDLGARVVMGRDLSPGGLRVEGGDGLEVGRILTVVLHGLGEEGPLPVRAHVARSTAEGDRVLRFIGLEAATKERLARLLAAPPRIESLTSEAEEVRCVVTEIATSG